MLINIEEGIRFVQPSIKEETQLFQIFSVYLYYLSCLKIDSFNPENEWGQHYCENEIKIYYQRIQANYFEHVSTECIRFR